MKKQKFKKLKQEVGKFDMKKSDITADTSMNDVKAVFVVIIVLVLTFIGGYVLGYKSGIDSPRGCYSIYNSRNHICLIEKGKIDGESVYEYELKKELR